MVRDTKQKVRSSLRDVGNVNVIKLKRSAGAFLVFFLEIEISVSFIRESKFSEKISDKSMKKGELATV